jgi:hypothetical protein
MSNTSAQIYTPGVGQFPYGLAQANPQASPYAQQSGFGVDTTILLDKYVKAILFDATPKKYAVLSLLFDKPIRTIPSDEWEYLEYSFVRAPIELAANVTAVPNIPGSQVSQTLTLTAPSMENIGVNSIIVFPGTNDQANVTAINASLNQITVTTPTSGGIPAYNISTSTPILPVQSSISGDGRTDLSNFQRQKFITRYNFVQQFQRAVRWGRWELQKYQNLARTDYLNVDVSQRMKNVQYDLFATFINGRKGEYRLAGPDNVIVKATDGVFPMMVAAGSAHANATTGTLKATFEALAFQTDFKGEGQPRFIVGAQKPLYELWKAYKETAVRYTPNDMVANLNLDEITIGGMKFVPIYTELLRETSILPPEFANRLLVLDLETIGVVSMAGIPSMETGSTLMIGKDGTREGFKDWFIMAQAGFEMHNPLSSFWIDVQGI